MEQCVECKGHLRKDVDSVVCIECGLVATHKIIEQGRERIFEEEGQVDRNGGKYDQVDWYKTDCGLGTYSTHSLTNQYANRSYQDRNYDEYVATLKNVSFAMKVPKVILNKCIQLYQRIKNEKIMDDKTNKTELLGSILFMLCLQEQFEVCPSQISTLLSIKIGRLKECYQKLRAKLLISQGVDSVVKHIHLLCTRLQLSYHFQKVATIIGKEPQWKNIESRSLAAVSIYVAVHLMGGPVHKQKMVDLPKESERGLSSLQTIYQEMVGGLEVVLPRGVLQKVELPVQLSL